MPVSLLLNWFKLVYGLFGQTNLQCMYTKFLPKTVGKDLNLPKIKNSHLSNNRGGWNKRGGGAKVAKSINLEAGINVECGIIWKKLVHN